MQISEIDWSCKVQHPGEASAFWFGLVNVMLVDYAAMLCYVQSTVQRKGSLVVRQTVNRCNWMLFFWETLPAVGHDRSLFFNRLCKSLVLFTIRPKTEDEKNNSGRDNKENIILASELKLDVFDVPPPIIPSHIEKLSYLINSPW